MRDWRERGLVGPRQPLRRGSLLDSHGDYLLGLVAAEPGLTLHEIARRLKDERGLGVSHVAVWKFYKARAISFKKNRVRRRPGS
jgi:transposase